jgi:acetoin utilization deacetylase AcuC-like enzyme
MILFDSRQRLNLTAFGIQIPIRDSRTTKTIRHLENHPRIGPRRRDWLRTPQPEVISAEDLERVHSSGYTRRLMGEGLASEIIRTFELVDAQGQYHRYAPDQARKPLAALFEGVLAVVAQTAQCGRLALQHGFCYALGGGMHHAHADHGSGFCLVNDIVIAARKLQSEGRAATVWVIDVDAHKGDGTAALTSGDESIVTLSIHMQDGWPLDGPEWSPEGGANPAFTPSDIDIPMAAGEDHLYLERLERGLERLARRPQPDLAMVVSGADPFELDELPSTQTLRLSKQQLLDRDRLVYRFLEKRAIPAAYLMAGGYGDATWQIYSRFLEWVLLRRLSTMPEG